MTDPSVDDKPSKSQRKRDAQRLFDLGIELSRLNAAQLADLPLSEPLRAAIQNTRRVKSHVARKRQQQYLAKLLRQTDAEPLFAALQRFQLATQSLTRQQHRIEYWRDRLLQGGDAVLASLLAGRPDLDRQAIRQLMRKAAREAGHNRPPAASRALFRLLRRVDREQPLPDPNPD